MIGRQLLMRGNSVWLVDDGRVTLPAAHWDISGGSDPALWRYRLDVPAPSETRTVTRAASDVLHVRIDPDVARPWVGVSPFTRCADTRAILCEVERKSERRAQVASRDSDTPFHTQRQGRMGMIPQPR